MLAVMGSTTPTRWKAVHTQCVAAAAQRWHVPRAKTSHVDLILEYADAKNRDCTLLP